jgi:Immune inhibitor A-like, MAM domain
MKRVTFLLVVGMIFATSFAVAEQEVERSAEFKAAVEAWESGAQLSLEQMNMLRRHVSPPNNAIDVNTGPDAFGYHVIDSDEPDGPEYAWIDITQTGEEVAAGQMLGDEDLIGPFQIGFDFPFYGETYNQFWIQSNGTITFFPTYVYAMNQSIPTITFDAMIAWFWDDLDPDNGVNGGHVYYEMREIGNVNTLIVSFIEIDEYPDGPSQDNVTAQVLLRENGNVFIQYQHIDTLMDTGSCTIGIQNADGTIGTGYMHNGAPDDFLHDELSLCFEVLPAEAILVGYVRDVVNDEPIVNAEVRSGDTFVLTGPDGEFNLGEFVTGQTIEVNANADGYFSSATEIVLVENLTIEEFSLAPFGRPLTMNYMSTLELNQGRLGIDEDLNPVWEHGEPTVEPPTAHSGASAWGTRIDINYSPNARDWLTTKQSFRIQEAGAVLKYWHWYNIESIFDGYNVHISTDGAETWELLMPVDGYTEPFGIWVNGWQPCFNNGGDTAGQWNLVEFNLDEYVGQQVWFGFYFTSDPFVQRTGVTIDDLEIFVENRVSPIEIYAEPTQFVLPEEGGMMQFHIIASNSQGSPIAGDLWTQLRKPNGTNSNVLTNITVVAEPGLNTFGYQSFDVPPNAAGGRYTLNAYLGDHPDTPITSAYYHFSKQLTSNGDIPIPPPDGVWERDPELKMTVHPNPLNMAASVSVAVPSSGLLSIRLYNLLGREVLRVNESEVSPGLQVFHFDATNLATGVYFMQAHLPDGEIQTQKVVLLK